MKSTIQILFLTTLLFSCGESETIATCNDGILNGTETGIDCGGLDCPLCDRSLEGVYKGRLEVVDEYNGDLQQVVENVSLNIIECSESCIELSIVTAGKVANTMGNFTKSNTFYQFSLIPIYEFPNMPQPWEEEWPEGGGTFDFVNNELVLSLTVDDEYAVGGTDAAYYFEGKQQ